MIKIDDWVHSTIDTYPYQQVRLSTESLLKAIRMLGEMAKPKHFDMSSCSLIRFEALPSNGKRHGIRVVDDLPIDEVYTWQVWGSIGGRTVNIISEYIFHTHKENRSGSGEWHVNGKDAYLREDMGGLAIDDIWQDNNEWKDYPQWAIAPVQEAK